MSQFLLIDHSLKSVGGHHLEYAVHVARAAEEAGYSITLATHRRFRAGDAIPERWQVRPVFPFTTYCRHTIYDSRSSGQRSLPTTGRFGGVWRDAIKDVDYRWGRWRRLRGFRRGLSTLLDQVPLAAGDHVFVPTLSELDLTALADVLATRPAAQAADWHLQFHFQIFEGREPDYPRQADRLALMQRAFHAAWPQLRSFRVHCYNTTAQLTAQYDRLGVAKFHTLPYPINPAFHHSARHEPPPPRDPDRPLRVTCAGAIRAEKGSQELATVLRDAWDELFAPGRAQLIVQSNKPQFRLPLPVETAAPSVATEAPSARDAEHAPVVYAPHPLAMEAYVDLMRRADVGLLLYDSDRYYARCSGVLVELLSLGVPVIVTAGCWMAEQIAPAILSHARQVAQQLATIARFPLPLTVVTAAEPATCRVALPTGADELAISFRWRSPTLPGTYLRLELEQFAADGESVARHVQIVGQPVDQEAAVTLFHAQPGVRSVRVTLRNAYHDAPLAVEHMSLDALSSNGSPGASSPLGAVGLIAADATQVGPLLVDMTRHWSHYRDTAETFAGAWRAYHHPRRIIADLLAAAAQLHRQRAA